MTDEEGHIDFLETQLDLVAKLGAELYAQNCAICHREGRNGPPLEGIMNRREFPSGTPANDARLKDTIRLGRAMMPAFSNTLTDAQIDAIVQYVHTL